MAGDSIAAYDVLARVASYDADMEVMHPNRAVMADVIVDILEAAAAAPKLVLDLGTGTGFLLERALGRFPEARAIAVEGASHMVDLAKSRLGSLARRVDCRVGDFRALGELCRDLSAIDAVISSFALHHLSRPEKDALLKHVCRLLRPGGWFLNADIVVSEDSVLEEVIQRRRVRGIVRRASPSDTRFADEATTRKFLDDLEQKEGDQPLTLDEDLAILRDAGFHHVDVFWCDTREVVYGGLVRDSR